jgi:hypothetical protein
VRLAKGRSKCADRALTRKAPYPAAPHPATPHPALLDQAIWDIAQAVAAERGTTHDPEMPTTQPGRRYP